MSDASNQFLTLVRSAFHARPAAAPSSTAARPEQVRRWCTICERDTRQSAVYYANCASYTCAACLHRDLMES